MAQRFSGYARRDRDYHPTPVWVTQALVRNLGLDIALGGLKILEPACGDGSMVAPLAIGNVVTAADIEPLFPGAIKADFLDPDQDYGGENFDAIITNPPYGIQGKTAVAFIERALAMMQQRRGLVAMLLKADFDSGSTRTHLFRDCGAWARKIVLLRRIEWFQSETGAGPSENHCWYVWSWGNFRMPNIYYEE